MISLKAARVNQNLTQEEAAKKLGVDRKTLCSWEKGKTFPSVKKISTIEKVYDITIDQLTFMQE